MPCFKIILTTVLLFSLSVSAFCVELAKGENPVELRILLQLRWVDFSSHTSIYDTNQVYSGFFARRGQIEFEGSLNQENIRWGIMIDPIALSNKITQDIYISLDYIPF